MFSLRMTAYLLAAPSLMGIFVIAVLSMEMGNAINISIAAIAGAVLGIPAAYVLAKQIDAAVNPKKRS